MNSKHEKGDRGFSFVEAIVVAVITAILAAVAIPIYTGFIRDQRKSTVNNLAQTAAASANAFLRRTGSSPTSVASDLQLYYDNGRYSISISGNSITVNDKSYASAYNTLSFN